MPCRVGGRDALKPLKSLQGQVVARPIGERHLRDELEAILTMEDQMLTSFGFLLD